ncbi:30S ribosomal protein S3 [Candidatus Nomurabacteria bacterium RIFCSPHIGHO2_02_FULL_33_12]|uniref:Small ribosomal subunit protein uS3 n=1 Tax=Candidatus Nomurabacteria bacterium RIFCSPLOWO2_01_FULL_33_17 TaxID=1801764 RepID=A0A1F6WQ33_9BACT|nr:MAG: 30S ribosomal protein S3 [Candidatus Nomurabacteria bacterium RIFCSPHIGHO2_02_FULL_33_12]OGI84022.1 MAG: 30S ribosomal protein S3 [Candidatus Nomurabacteria bacterium RIFCSPLOWO2_01_FULL_33_17]
MSKTVHPYAHRLVVLRDWKSRWFAEPKIYKDFLKGDALLRNYLTKKLRGSYVAGVEIERGQKGMRIIIKTSRPGMIIGRQGEGATKMRADIVKFMKRADIFPKEDIRVDIQEITSPDADAAIVAYSIAEAMERRMPFRRIMKSTIEKVMGTRGVRGVRIYLGGRLGGAEIARTENMKKGSIPLQTFRADVDFAREKAHMTYGDIGIKVWIYKGEVFNQKTDTTIKK